jgi:hypothetical protein
MQSDDRTGRALAALRGPREAFLSAVVAAVDEVRAFLAAHRPGRDDGAARAARELGAFAAGRIDAASFDALFTGGAALDPASVARVERALAELGRVAAAGDALFRVRVAPHADLHLVAGHALASAGSAFGAAQLVERVRSGRFRAGEHADRLEAFPFRRWNRAERQIAPPLVVEVEGADLKAGGLAEFLDGAQKIVLVVNAPAPPAALVRLVTPGVFVAQTDDRAELERAARFPGPAVAALVPEGAALFTHDPAAGPTLADRLAVRRLPEPGAVAPLDGMSAAQQRDELALLRELAERPSAASRPQPAPAGEPAMAAAPAPEADAADRLAEEPGRQAELG